MGADYAYDEEGYLWPFFVFTLTFIVTLPLTYLLVSRSRDPAAALKRVQSDYRHEHADLVDTLRKQEKRKDRKLWLLAFVMAGWAVMGYMLYLINTTEAPTQKIWNPYDILSIPESASIKVIKSTYKKLSLRFHPDKIRPDASRNETLEDLNARYVEISKAYQALTDEEVRNNYIQYGNPDGKQGYSINIALPKAMVSDGNGKYIVLIYSALFGVLLPYLVGSWWYGTLRRSKEGSLMESANRLFRAYQDDIDEGGVITALSEGKEYEDLFKGNKADSQLSRIESKILAEGELSPFAGGLSVKHKEKLQNLESGPQRKALALLWAYLGRVELDDPALNKAKLEVAPISHALNKSFTAISLAYMNTAPLLASYYTSQLLIQALPPKSSPLLQLPYFTPKIVKAVEGDSRIRTSVQSFMDRPDSKRRSLVVGKNLLTEQQYKEAVKVAKQLPYLRVAKAYFKVTGERCIIPSSLVTLVVKGRFVPPGSEKLPEVNEPDLEDIDPAEDDLDAILGRKTKKQIGKDENGKPIMSADSEPILPPLASAPYFARDHSPRWHVFLTDSKQGRVAVPPFTFAQFDRPVFQEDGRTPTFAMQTLKAQFQAPPQAGHYTFVMHVVCDSYVGFDTKMEVTLIVDEASKAAEMADDDQISEPDEGWSTTFLP
ncbi:Sec63 Brl domain-containing protein [Lasiosphaeria miniovina]|uniref:Sec63 Brl domain-containing protein n=1 Tax=Lasiosphaeria miniovina TaxID=1954250 RepID=A0AA40E3V9_9PEZI|nr:Sec63 Brl domain-containing protein [Lasiosphaeria miniovina]KAK0723096.1 Sec63 Brl domain-containing protein [Lasiosphaeria miniovina]